MIKLPLELKKNGVILKQLRRTEKTALYSVSSQNEQTKEWMVTGYEVFKIKVAKECEAFNKILPEHESVPSNESFGSSAWTYDKIETAEKKFDELEKVVDLP